MPGKTRVGWVHINTRMHMTRTRPDRRKLFWGSMAPPSQDEDTESDHWEALPYAVGLLQAYVQKHAAAPEDYEFLVPLYKRVPIEQALQHLNGADVVGFSVYLWNINLSLAIARRLKEQQPETLIVFGGPQIPPQAEVFLRQHPFVDIVCHGEGEHTFLSILENNQTRNWEHIQSVSYLRADGSFADHPLACPIENLDTITSPYLEGVFQPLMQANPHEKWMALWETNRGCPFSCSFCSWDSRDKVKRFDQGRLLREINWMADNQIEYIHCCDANYGIFPRDLAIAQYVTQVAKEHNYPRFFFVENDGCFRERAFQIHDTLHQAELNGTVILAVQSMSTQALKNVKRKDTVISLYQSVQQRFAHTGIRTLTEMILALPGETYDSFVSGVSQVIEQGGQHGIACYNCSILPKAEMATPDYQTKFGLHTVPQQIIAMHSELADTTQEHTPEFAETVIATTAMPETDWVRSKTFCWMTDLLYFDRVLRIPLDLIHHLYEIHYRDLIEVILNAAPDQYPLLAEIQTLFVNKARDIQAGAPEYCSSEAWLGIWWPADQYALIKLIVEQKIDGLYSEVQQVLTDCLQAQGVTFDPALLQDAITLNRSLLVRPFCLSNQTLNVSYNVWELYESMVRGEPVDLKAEPHRYRVFRARPIWLSEEDWLEYLIFCYHNKESYWYHIKP